MSLTFLSCLSKKGLLFVLGFCVPVSQKHVRVAMYWTAQSLVGRQVFGSASQKSRWEVGKVLMSRAPQSTLIGK
jgi:hypothetical protein